MGPWLVGFAFWLFLAAAAVAGIVADYKKRKLEIEPLRAAIERGQQVDLALIERLMAREPREHGLDPMDFRVGGIITISAGAGVGLLALISRTLGFIASLKGVSIAGIGEGVGFVAICVGTGLLIVAAQIKRERTD